jgi:CHASE domain/RNA polymerase Rpb6
MLLREAREFGARQSGILGGLTALASKLPLPRGLLAVTLTIIALVPCVTPNPASLPSVASRHFQRRLEVALFFFAAASNLASMMQRENTREEGVGPTHLPQVDRLEAASAISGSRHGAAVNDVPGTGDGRGAGLADRPIGIPPIEAMRPCRAVSSSLPASEGGLSVPWRRLSRRRGSARGEFETFAELLLRDQTAIQSVSWIPRVSHAEREARERAAVDEGIPGYHITSKRWVRAASSAKHGEHRMGRITVEDCVDKVANRFDLVLLAAHRARAQQRCCDHH